MKKTIAVTVYVDVEVSKGGKEACKRFAKENVVVIDRAVAGIHGSFFSKPSEKPKSAEVFCDGHYKKPKKEKSK